MATAFYFAVYLFHEFAHGGFPHFTLRKMVSCFVDDAPDLYIFCTARLRFAELRLGRSNCQEGWAYARVCIACAQLLVGARFTERSSLAGMAAGDFLCND